MTGTDIEALKAMSAAELAAKLSGAPDERVAIVRTAAEAGLAEAQAVYGQMLLDGVEIPLDQRAAFGWFMKAAAQRHVMAVNMVGRCYDLGWGTPVDKDRAAQCFRYAAEAGLDWGLYNYATALTLGEGVAEDRPAALALFRKAAGQGNAKAANYVGSFHEDGWVVAQDLALAEHWYRQAAEGGDFRGRFNLARLLGARGEIDEALAWLARVRETANAPFLEKAEHWLRGAKVPAFRDRGLAALRG